MRVSVMNIGEMGVVLLPKAIEAAQVAFVVQLYSRDVIGNRAGFACDGQHVTGRDVEELGVAVDETAMSQRQAMRSILGRSRVIHFMNSPHAMKVLAMRPTTAQGAMTFRLKRNSATAAATAIRVEALSKSPAKPAGHNTR